MNLPVIHSPAESCGEARPAGADRRHGDAFARLLDCKAAAPRDDGGAPSDELADARPRAALRRRFDDEAAPDSTPGVPPAGGAPVAAAQFAPTMSAAAPFAPTMSAAAPCTAAALPGSVTAPRAAFEAVLDGMPPLAPVAAADTGTWEASVGGPSGVAIELRASRGGGPDGWTLTISSPTVGAALLAQHAPRLNERLRARALAGTHVRIERDDGEDA